MTVYWREWFLLSALSTLLVLPAPATAQTFDELAKQMATPGKSYTITADLDVKQASMV
jgi:hypothetical protein